MKASDIKIGHRVLVMPNNLNALVVGDPEYYTPRAKLVRIKYENSTRYEHKLNNQLELLPPDQQYEAHGGTYVKPEGNF
tara:strand:+ start:251 stop:487 length:237 start_codon:yes stop_codon:yes gene_type:complete